MKPDAKKAKAAYQDGIRAEGRQDWDAAYTDYSDAANWAQGNREYLLRREIARSRLVQARVDAAERDAISGRLDEARRELLGANYLDPSNSVVRERLTELLAGDSSQVMKPARQDIPGEPHLAYQPGKQKFDYRGDTQGAYDELAREFGVEVACDVDLRARQVRLQLDDVDFPTVARLLGDATGTFWRPLSRRLFFVADDTPQKRRDYDASVLRTILLPASETPDQMTEVLRVVREIAGITRSDLDTRTRTLTLRASPRAIAVASDLIDQIEQPVGELILEIEVLEVDRNRAQQLGIVPPQTARAFTLSSQQIQEAAASEAGLLNVIEQVFGLPSSLSGLTPTQIASLLGSGQISLGSLIPPLVAFGGGKTTFLATLPGAAANFSEMLSLVRHGQRILLRAQDGQPATFFVGDRIPVSLATFSASLTGAGANIAGVSSTNFPTTEFPVGNAPTFVATTVLRAGSSENDLIVANSADNTIGVLLGTGTGNFLNQVTYPTGNDPVWIATGQFNNSAAAVNSDSVPDVAVANKGANTVSILLGSSAGDGTFQPKSDIPTGNSPVSVVAANFHDSVANHPVDLAVANQADNSISLFEGNGDGTFKAPVLIQLPAGFAPAALAVADFNNDGHIDLAVADEGNNTVSVFLGNGDGTFQARADYAVGNSPVFVAIGDFNGDGFSDLATANNGATSATNTGNTVSILLNQTNSIGSPTGTFAPPASERDFPAGNGPTSIAVADYNVDGRPDLAVTSQGDKAVSILLNLGGGLFGPDFELPVGTAPVSIVTADFNGDSRPDVAVANNGSNNVSVILNSSSFTGAVNNAIGTPFPGVQYLDIGLKVKATPRIHGNSDVSLQLGFEISSLTSQSFNSIPVISSETVDQTVRLKQNQTAAVAGFLQSQLTNAITGNPGIAAIPGIGRLDENQNAQKQESEVLILVTPRMVRLAPREDHVIYAGKGALEGPAGGGTPVALPPQPQRGEGQPPPLRERVFPGQPAPPGQGEQQPQPQNEPPK